MLPEGRNKQLAKYVAAFVHAQQLGEAAKLISDFCGIAKKFDNSNPKECHPILLTYLHSLLNSGGMEEAAQILWTPNQFSCVPKYTKDLWKLFDSTNRGLVMGAASCSKSYALGVRLFLEWIRDPVWTSIQLVGPSEDHLETNLFSHIVGLHTKATLPMPGQIGELFIGMDRRNQLGAIKGVIIPVGKSKKAGRLQGGKRLPRDRAHPIFGLLSRKFAFIDEIENVPAGLWADIDNMLSTIDEQGHEGMKIFGAYNPSDRNLEVGKRAEPPFGWESFDVDNHFRWKSKRGWDVMRLDGEKSENVIAGKTIIPGLQTRAGLAALALNAGGTQSAGYFTMGRGAYPPTGIELTLIPPGMLYKMRGEFVWYDAPTPCASCDVALTGGARAVYSLGKYGKATGMKLPPTIEFPTGQTVMFKDKNGHVVPRWGVQLDRQFTIPQGDTVAVTTSLMQLNRRAGVKPQDFACDRTGNGAGVADLLRHDWSSQIHDVNYSEGPTKTRIVVEDKKPCDEMFDRMCSELWFGFRTFGEFHIFLIHPQVEMAKLTEQITGRKSKNIGEKSKIESKKDYISRGNESPDEADSATLLVLAARLGSGVIPSVNGTEMPTLGNFDGWEDEMYYPNGVRLDPSARTDYLDTVESSLYGGEAIL